MFCIWKLHAKFFNLEMKNATMPVFTYHLIDHWILWQTHLWLVKMLNQVQKNVANKIFYCAKSEPKFNSIIITSFTFKSLPSGQWPSWDYNSMLNSMPQWQLTNKQLFDPLFELAHSMIIIDISKTYIITSASLQHCMYCMYSSFLLNPLNLIYSITSVV